MVTMAQVHGLEARIDALADRMNPTPRIRYHVQLVWMQPDRSVLDSDSNELRVFAPRSRRKRSVGPTRARGQLVCSAHPLGMEISVVGW